MYLMFLERIPDTRSINGGGGFKLDFNGVGQNYI